jgi:hypothetical protein
VNFNVYLDDESAARLDRLARRSRTARNALIRKAVHAWLEGEASSWPKIVLEYRGDPSIAPFEARRAELLAPADDPFAPRAPRRAARKPRSST